MQRVTLTTVTPLLAMTIALFLQGCGGSGGESSSPAVQTSSAATGSGTGITSSKVGIHPASGLAGAAVAISGNGFADACGVALFLDKTGGHSLVDGKMDVQEDLDGLGRSLQDENPDWISVAVDRGGEGRTDVGESRRHRAGCQHPPIV